MILIGPANGTSDSNGTEAPMICLLNVLSLLRAVESCKSDISKTDWTRNWWLVTHTSDHLDISRRINICNETVIKLCLFLSDAVSLNYTRLIPSLCLSVCPLQAYFHREHKQLTGEVFCLNLYQQNSIEFDVGISRQKLSRRYACSFIVCWFSLSFTTCFGLRGHLQVCRIFIFMCLKDSASLLNNKNRASRQTHARKQQR
jgi:hypothetical protein